VSVKRIFTCDHCNNEIVDVDDLVDSLDNSAHFHFACLQLLASRYKLSSSYGKGIRYPVGIFYSNGYEQ
jgi:hypothetical protein